jgi:hypothetical protein
VPLLGHGDDRAFELVERLEAVAARLERLLVPDAVDGGTQLVDAAVVADAIGHSRDYVYEHADELGAVRLGAGPRPRLRFDLRRAVAAYAASCSTGRSADAAEPPRSAPSRRQRARISAAGPDRLPMRDTSGRRDGVA